MATVFTRVLCILAVTHICPVLVKAQERDLLITGTNVVDVRSGLIRHAVDLAIADGRIVAVGSEARLMVGAGASVVDATGMYVIPGLWDMHVHAHRAGRANWFYPLLVAHGVTGIREMSSHLGSLLEWRHNRPPLSPRIHWSTPMIDGAPPTWNQGLVAETPAAARQLVRTMKDLGFDLIKVYGRLTRETYFALAEEAGRAGIPFAGHVPYSVSPLEASDAGQRSIEHLWLVLESCIPGALNQVVELGNDQIGMVDSKRLAKLLPQFDVHACDNLFARFRANQTWQTPTLVQERGAAFMDDSAFVNDSRMIFVPKLIQSEWHAYRQSRSADDIEAGRTVFHRRMELVASMQRAGVGLLAGTDASDEPWVFPGSSLHDELTLLVEAGLSPLQALQTATVNPAIYFNAADSMGSVAPGMLADLVVLTANPLDDIANTRRIHAVVLQGRLLDRAMLGMLRESGKNAANR